MTHHIHYNPQEPNSKNHNDHHQLRIPMKTVNSQPQPHYDLFKFCSEQQIKQLSRKNHIKISKNKLPSDFFGPLKPASFSASLPRRAKKTLLQDAPFASKKLNSESQLTTGQGEIQQQQVNQLLKLTSYFGSLDSQLSPHKQICLTDRKFQSQKNTKIVDQFISLVTSRENSVQRRKIRSMGKARLFDNNPKQKATIQLQLPLIKSNPLTKIQKKNKFSEDSRSHTKPQLQKKVSALMYNSSLPPQSVPMFKPESQRLRHRHTNTLQININKQDTDMNITFCSPEKKIKNFFKQ